jgi:hypothetical protein
VAFLGGRATASSCLSDTNVSFGFSFCHR